MVLVVRLDSRSQGWQEIEAYVLVVLWRLDDEAKI